MIKRHVAESSPNEATNNNLKAKTLPSRNAEHKSESAPSGAKNYACYAKSNSASSYFANNVFSAPPADTNGVDKKNGGTLAFPFTLNSLISGSLNGGGALAPLTDLNFNSVAATNGNCGFGKSQYSSPVYANGFSESKSPTSTSTSSSFASPDSFSNGGGSVFSLGSPFEAGSKSKNSICNSYAGDAHQPAINNDLDKLSQLLSGTRNEPETPFDASCLRAKLSSVSKGVTLDDNDNLQHFWDARMKDIADAMTYLELI